MSEVVVVVVVVGRREAGRDKSRKRLARALLRCRRNIVLCTHPILFLITQALLYRREPCLLQLSYQLLNTSNLNKYS